MILIGDKTSLGPIRTFLIPSKRLKFSFASAAVSQQLVTIADVDSMVMVSSRSEINVINSI